MRKLLNVLYITNPLSYLSKDGENVVVRVEDQDKVRLPIHNIEGIVCFGYPGASPALMAHCAEKGIGFSFVSESGRFLARVTGPVSGNIVLRKKQYKISDDESKSLEIARNIIISKIMNSRTVFQRFLRDHTEKDVGNSVRTSITRLQNIAVRVVNSSNLEDLRGAEGEAAKCYFDAFDNLILCQKEEFSFNLRSRRPPLDRVNALMSFIYVLLAHDVESALETVGLDPQAGFLHRDRPGRASLALDIMEELRAYLADRLVLNLINNRQIKPADFTIKETGAVLLNPEARKTVITSWQQRKRDKITHPFLDEKLETGLIPYAQALLLARHLRGDLDEYPPFFMK